MAEPYKCHEIEIMNSNSLRGNFKQTAISITFHDGVGLQDLLLYPGVLSGHSGQELQDQFGALRLPGTGLSAKITYVHVYKTWKISLFACLNKPCSVFYFVAFTPLYIQLLPTDSPLKSDLHISDHLLNSKFSDLLLTDSARFQNLINRNDFDWCTIVDCKLP